MNRRVRARWPKVLRLEPGDVVLLEPSRRITPEEAEAIRRQWESRVPDVPVAVLVGLTAKVLRAVDVPPTPMPTAGPPDGPLRPGEPTLDLLEDDRRA